MYLLLEIKKPVFIFIKIAKHMEAFCFTDVIDHIILQKLIDIVGRNFTQLHPVDAFEGGPWLETMLFGQLLALLFNNLFVFSDGP